MNITRSMSAALGVRLRIHYSWIAVFIFMTAAMITQFSTNYPFLERLALGLVASGLYLIIGFSKGICVQLPKFFFIIHNQYTWCHQESAPFFATLIPDMIISVPPACPGFTAIVQP